MRIRSLIFAPVAVLSVLVGVLVFAGVPAQAAGVRSEIGHFGPTGEGSTFTQPQSIAVEQETGDVYVYNVNEEEEGSVYKFNAEGVPVNFSSTGTNAIGPFRVSGAPYEGQIAVDNSTGPNKGDIYIASYFEKEVYIYSPAGAKLASLITEEAVCGVAVDSNGNLYTSMPDASEKRISKYEPLSEPIEENDLAEGLEVGKEEFCDIAADSAGDIYAAGYEDRGSVVKYEASQFETVSPTGAVIDSSPGAATLTVDPESGEDVYINEQSDVAVYTSGGTEIEEFGTGLLSKSFGVAVSDASDHVGDVYAPSAREESEVLIFGPPSAAPKFPLKVEKEGTGAAEGKVTSSPSGIACGTGAGCEAEFEEGETVTLTATEEGATFTKWTGCETEPTPTTCEVEMTEAKTVKAEFTAAVLAEFPVTITSITGEGEVTGATIACTPGGIGTALCTEEAKEGTSVTLTATPKAGSGYAFKEWTGKECAASKSSTCTFPMPTEAVDEQAVFAVPTTSPLNVYITGNGEVKGTMIACTQLGGVCEEQAKGPTTLTAAPDPGYVFAGWIGCKKTTADTCEVDVTAPSEVTAVFLLEGKEGHAGPTGPQGTPGANGEQGEKGVAGTNGTDGLNGLPGPAGLQGPIGPTGAQGPAGPAGKEGPAGKVQVVTCTKRGKKKKCTTKTVSGTVKFTTSSARATLSRHGVVYAAGAARAGTHGDMSLRLLSLRKLEPGKYTLTLISGGGRNETIHREAFMLR